MSSLHMLRGCCWFSAPVYLGAVSSIAKLDTQNRYYGFRLVREPESPRVLRGGSWITYPVYTRSANSNFNDPKGRCYDLSFRLVRAQK